MKKHYIQILDIGGGAVQVISHSTKREADRAKRTAERVGCPVSKLITHRGEISPETWDLIDAVASATHGLSQ